MTLSDPPRRPLALRDASEALGISEMTVSRVLRDSGEVSEKTRERVLEAANAWVTCRTGSQAGWPAGG